MALLQKAVTFIRSHVYLAVLHERYDYFLQLWVEEYLPIVHFMLYLQVRL